MACTPRSVAPRSSQNGEACDGHLVNCRNLTFAHRTPAIFLLHSRPVADLTPVPSVQQLFVGMVCEDLDHLLLGLAIQLGGLVGFLQHTPDAHTTTVTQLAIFPARAHLNAAQI